MESIVEVVGVVIAIDPPMNEDKTGVINPEVEYWEALTFELMSNPAVRCVHECQPANGMWIVECHLGDSLDSERIAQRIEELKSFCKAVYDKYLALSLKEPGESVEEALTRKDEAKPASFGR